MDDLDLEDLPEFCGKEGNLDDLGDKSFTWRVVIRVRLNFGMDDLGDMPEFSRKRR